jgi:hypothetical protein
VFESDQSEVTNKAPTKLLAENLTLTPFPHQCQDPEEQPRTYIIHKHNIPNFETSDYQMY